MKHRSTLLLTGVPGLVLAASLACILVRYGTWWPWAAIVHEDGQRTLLGTIFYFEHALGELPLEWLLALACAGGACHFYVPARSYADWVWVAGAMAVGIDLAIAIGAWFTVGGANAVSWLLQYHTRNEAPLVFGSHWQYHLLSEAMLMLWAALLFEAGAIREGLSGASRGRAVWWASWVALAVLSIGFGLSAAPFRDARFLGHQARESFTHALVTVPLACGLCLAAAHRPTPVAGKLRLRLGWGTAILAIGCLALGFYQLFGAVLSGSRQQAQTGDFARLVCGHFFEHTFSYAVVASHALWFFLFFGRRGSVQN